MKKFYRDSNDEMVAGVCSGIANYVEVDVTLVRLAFILGTILISGFGVLVYIIALVAPKEP